MQVLTIDLDCLAQALDSRDASQRYLDLDSGAVLAIAPGEPLPGAEEKYRIEPQRYLPIEPLALAEAVAMREDFLLTEPHPHAHKLLSAALEDRRPLRRFDFELKAFAEIREAWTCYQAAQLRELALAWLAEQGIEPRPAGPR